MDFEKCQKELEVLADEIGSIAERDVATKVSQILNNNNNIISRKKSGRSSCKWYTSDLHDLRKEVIDELWAYRRSGEEQLAKSYALLRGSYHRALRATEQQFKEDEVKTLIGKSYVEGLNCLYRSAKPQKSSETIDASAFASHCRSLFASAPEPVLERVPGCNPAEHELSNPITEEEVKKSMEKMDSKAKSASGLSPFTLQKLAIPLLPLLIIIFNFALRTCTFPLHFLESCVFFLHKGGEKLNPRNYRSIALENPFLKLLTSILAERISRYSFMAIWLPQRPFHDQRSWTLIRNYKLSSILKKAYIYMLR